MFMKHITMVLLVFMSMLSINCSSDDDNSSDTLAYEGEWSGTYTGAQDNGSWTMQINTDGTVSGTATSEVFNGTYTVSGFVQENGDLTATVGNASSGALFTGQLDGSNASGTWNNTTANMSGEWSGTQQ